MEVAIFGPAISAFAGVAGAFLGLFMTTKNTQRTLAANAQLNQVAAKERANEREARNYGDQLERFYIPYRLLASANFMLAQELRERLKHGERFFIKIFDKEWLNSLAEGDREIIQMICANADVLKGMIEQKITPVDMKLLRWTRLVRQFGGLAKVDRVRFYAAN
ncbi:hypothetical protein, partial [Nitrobacter sp.]